MVASCAGAALGCYLVSLRVASERAALEDVETQIVLAQRDIRLLQTEIGTRGRLAQLERWNVKVLRLSAPSADQFVDGGFALARMVMPERKPALEAPVVLASAPAESAPAQAAGSVGGDEPLQSSRASELLHTASLKRPDRIAQTTDKPAEIEPGVKREPSRAPVARAQPGKAGAGRSPAAEPTARAQPSKTAKAAGRTPEASLGAAKKTVDKPANPAARPMTKPAKLAKTDPLAPMPATTKSKTAKD